jgi:hypothetical protein
MINSELLHDRKIKHFDFDEKDQALAWLETGR